MLDTHGDHHLQLRWIPECERLDDRMGIPPAVRLFRRGKLGIVNSDPFDKELEELYLHT